MTTAGFQPATLSRPDPYSGAVMQLRFTWPNCDLGETRTLKGIMTICLEDRDASNYVLRDHDGVIIYCLCSDILRKRSSQKKTLIKYPRRESNPY